MKKKSASRKTPKAKTTQAKANEPTLKAFSNTWPLERDILWRPERFKYVRKLIKQEGCVFCEALKKGVGPESLMLAASERSMVLLNKFPYNTGHLLVLPKRHSGDLHELTQEEFIETQNMLRQSLVFLKDSYGCHGFNVGINLGAAGGAGIPEHLHYHIVPRWAGDANFFPLIAETKVLPETLEQTFERLVPYYQDLSFLR